MILCPTCHNLIHGEAIHLVSCIRKNAVPSKRFWGSAELEERAKRLVQIIVKSFIEDLPEGAEISAPLTFTVSAKVKRDLQLLQSDLGLSSMEKTLAYCANYTLENRGIKNEQNAPMWFLPASKPRKGF